MGLRNWTVLSPVGQDSNARTVPTKIHPTASRFLPAGGLGSGPSNRATEIIPFENVPRSATNDDVCLCGRISRIHATAPKFGVCGTPRGFASATTEEDTVGRRHPLDDTERR